MSSLKTKINNNELTIGSWITFADTSVAEIMARAGYDWLTIDMEHSAITIREAQQLMQVIDLCGVVPLVRVEENDACAIKRVMDAGAHGVIVPMVNSREEAVAAVSAVKYPPQGNRPVGLSRAQGYGVTFDQYKEWVRKESIVIIQIEHIDAVENLEEILTVEGVDGFFVGPYDLSASLGKPGDLDCPQMKSALARIVDVSSRIQKTSGFHVVTPRPELVQGKIDEGYRFIAYSVDFLFLGKKCRDGLKSIKESNLVFRSER